jgi:hypothetical protein
MGKLRAEQERRFLWDLAAVARGAWTFGPDDGEGS